MNDVGQYSVNPERGTIFYLMFDSSDTTKEINLHRYIFNYINFKKLSNCT